MRVRREDYQTSTVDAAEAYERFHADPEDNDYDEEDDEENEDYCGCSDPGCPCGGSKRGSL